MLVLSTKLFNKLTGTGGQADRRANLGIERLAPPKMKKVMFLSVLGLLR